MQPQICTARTLVRRVDNWQGVRGKVSRGVGCVAKPKSTPAQTSSWGRSGARLEDFATKPPERISHGSKPNPPIQALGSQNGPLVCGSTLALPTRPRVSLACPVPHRPENKSTFAYPGIVEGKAPCVNSCNEPVVVALPRLPCHR